MSQINTNGINVNYPVPGKNNSTQGFRDNFAQIRNQLNTAASEITDIQTKAVVKAALDNTVIDNDMANTLISNAATKGFRSTTYNLGTSLSGIVIVDVSRADVQYGTIAGNTTLQFANWAPNNTQSTVTLRFTNTNPNAVIQLPTNCVSANNNFGVTLLENYSNVNGTATLSMPADTSIVEYKFSTLDCGETITVSPTNRPYKSTQIVTRTPPPTGVPGDVPGEVAVSGNYIYVCTAPFDSEIKETALTATKAEGNLVVLENTVGLVEASPIIFSGDTDYANSNIYPGSVYYIKEIVNTFELTISLSRTNGNIVGDEVALGNSIATTNPSTMPKATSYIGENIWKRVSLGTW